jgi:hypothetical protein
MPSLLVMQECGEMSLGTAEKSVFATWLRAACDCLKGSTSKNPPNL